METYLKLKFKGSSGKFYFIRLAKPKKNLTKEVVQEAMESIAAAHAFANGNDVMYVTPISAKYVTTSEEVVVEEEKVN